MIFQGKAVLVYLEEDNISRAFFRIRPLMTQEGALGQEIGASFPDEGYLRIVPDKNEQHTFKERMRSLCGLCLMDLRFLPAESNKIRTNKNYSPARGENNQFIVYSDAVRSLPDDMLYQVVSEGDAQSAVTPYVYIRNGANIQGPFKKDAEKFDGEGKMLPPDNADLHTLTLSEGQELLIYWPKADQPAQEAPANAAPAPAPQAPAAQAVPKAESHAPIPDHNTYVYQNGQFIRVTKETPAAPAKEQNAYQQIQEMNVTLSENANRLNAPASVPAPFVPEQPQKPLSGTRLYQAPQRQASPRRAFNPLMEAVEQQRYAAKYEAPGAVLPQNAELKDVSNPVDAFKRALQGLWQSTDAQHQAVDVLLAQPSMKAMLSKAMAADGRDATLTAMKTQLQDLEAERLMILMQLDDAKKNLAAFKEEALGDVTKDQQRKIDDLKNAQQQAQKALAAAQDALSPLNEKCRQAAEKLAELQKPFADTGAALFLSPAAGQQVGKAQLIERVEKSLKAAGFALQPGDAQAMLAIFALSQHNLEICAENQADALMGYQAFAASLGSKIIETGWEQHVHVLESGNAPLFILDCAQKHPLITNVLIASTAADYADFHAEDHPSPYASIQLETDLNALPGTLPAYAPVAKACIEKEMLKESALNQDTLSLILQLRKALQQAGRALPLCLVTSLCRFIAATQNDLPGGVAEAIDRGVCAYVAPHILLYKLPVDDLKNLLAAMPRTLKALRIV